MKKPSRPASPIEAGPIRITTAADMGTRWSAVLFTLVVGLGVLYAFENAPAWIGAGPVAEPATSSASR